MKNSPTNYLIITMSWLMFFIGYSYHYVKNIALLKYAVQLGFHKSCYKKLNHLLIEIQSILNFVVVVVES